MQFAFAEAQIRTRGSFVHTHRQSKRRPIDKHFPAEVELRDTSAAESCISLAANSACIIVAVATGNVVTMLGGAAGQVSAFCDCADCLPDDVRNFMEEKKVCSASDPVQKVADVVTGNQSFGSVRNVGSFAWLFRTELVLSVTMGSVLEGW